MDRALKDWSKECSGDTAWSLEQQTPDLLYTIVHKPFSIARKRAARASSQRPSHHPRHNAPITHDDVISQFTMGNWSNLLGEALPAHREQAIQLWENCLHNAFPQVPLQDPSRIMIGRRFERLTRLRNRVSHQENLLETNVRHRLNDMMSILSAINKSYPHWVQYGANVRVVASQDPRKFW